MKKIMFLSLVVFSLFFLTSCKSESIELKKDYISFSCIAKERVTLEIEFGFDDERLSNYPREEVQQFKLNLKKNVENLRNEFLILHALQYTQNPIQEYAINKGVFLSPVACRENSVGFLIEYSSLSAWQFYNSSSKDNQQSSNKYCSNFYLVRKIENTGKFVFAQTMSNRKTLGEKYKEMYLSALSSLTFESIEIRQYNPCFVYDYATTSSGLRSDAEKQVVSSQLYHHVWIKEGNNFADAKICLWQYDVNYGLWQFLAMAICLIPCAIIVALQLKKERQIRIEFNENK